MKNNKSILYAKSALLGIALITASCSKDEMNNETVGENPDSIEAKQVYFGSELVTVTPNENGTFKLDGSMGDVDLFPNQISENKIESTFAKAPDAPVSEKLALYSGIRKWTNNTVVYKLGNLSSSVRNELFKSMDVWAKNTTIKFKEHTNEKNYVTISQNGQNCNCGVATLGMNGNRGYIRLGSRTTAVVIIHEIGHTLGYIHEQTRSDRDQYVTILEENIQEGAKSQFRKNTNSENLGAFDIESIMMYGAYTFSKNGNPTIVKNNGETYPRKQAKLSKGDIEGTLKAYPGSVDPDPDPNPDDICKGVEEWVRGKRYVVGDRVTYKGYLYEADFSRWNRIGKCGTTQPTDICEGVAPYNGRERYSPGDQVTYNGYLYTLQNNKRWKQEGKCGR